MTYIALANITLTSTLQSVTFSSIPTTGYRDLVLVADFRASAVDAPVFLRVNALTGSSDYAQIAMTGNGSTAARSSGLDSRIFVADSSFGINPSSGSQRGAFIAHFLDYNQTNKHKSVLVKGTNGDLVTSLTTGRAITTSAITTIIVSQTQGTNGAFVSGSNFALYGIAG